MIACVSAGFFLALLVALGATAWLPEGAGKVNNLVFPAVAFPLVWVGIAVFLLGARRRRAWAISLGVALLAALPALIRL